MSWQKKWGIGANKYYADHNFLILWSLLLILFRSCSHHECMSNQCVETWKLHVSYFTLHYNSIMIRTVKYIAYMLHSNTKLFIVTSLWSKHTVTRAKKYARQENFYVNHFSMHQYGEEILLHKNNIMILDHIRVHTRHGLKLSLQDCVRHHFRVITQ